MGEDGKLGGAFYLFNICGIGGIFPIIFVTANYKFLQTSDDHIVNLKPVFSPEICMISSPNFKPFLRDVFVLIGSETSVSHTLNACSPS